MSAETARPSILLMTSLYAPLVVSLLPPWTAPGDSLTHFPVHSPIRDWGSRAWAPLWPDMTPAIIRTTLRVVTAILMSIPSARRLTAPVTPAPHAHAYSTSKSTVGAFLLLSPAWIVHERCS